MIASAWTEVCELDEVKDDIIYGGEANGTMVAIYRVNDRYFATDNICPHAYALLSDGWLEGHEVECPLHGARFSVETGDVISGPAECGLKTYQVRIENGKIFCLV